MNSVSDVPDLPNGNAPQPVNNMLKEIFVRYYDRLLYFATQYIHDKETARDLVQEAFVNYWNQIDKVSPEETKIRNYLYVSVRNACLKYLRHDKVVDKYHSGLDPDPSEESMALNNIIRSEVLGEIYRAIESLPESCRRISRMGYIEGMKNQEIADELGISINTVKTQKQRALQLLRLRLQPQTFLAMLVALPFLDK
jgi:RNA polymerase sigma-70 factor (family 1)